MTAISIAYMHHARTLTAFAVAALVVYLITWAVSRSVLAEEPLIDVQREVHEGEHYRRVRGMQ